MCMIIYRPGDAKGTVSVQRLRYIAAKNSDGFGLMWANEGRLVTARYAVKQRKQFIDRFLLLQRNNIPVCAHFRWATHGGVTRANTHPFTIVAGESAMMHNGVFDIKCEKGWSDTRTFAELVLKRLPADWHSKTESPYLYLIEQATGGNRIVVMFKTGEVIIFHEKIGTWEDEVWYSNSNFAPLPTKDSKDDKDKDDKDKGDHKASRSSDSWNYWLKEEAKGGRGWRKNHHGTASHYDYGEGMDVYDGDYVEQQYQTFSRWGKTENGETDKLYLYEQMMICADCLRMEATAQRDAVEIPEITSDDFCELCGVTGGKVDIAGSDDTVTPPVGTSLVGKVLAKVIGKDKDFIEYRGNGAGNLHS